MLRTNYPITIGAFTPIPALRFARQVRIREDETVGQSGLALTFPDDNFTNVINYAPADYPIIIGNVTAQGRGEGPLIGYPAQTGLTARPASVYCMVKALTAATTIVVEEID